jgi:hypothetical protein
MALTSDVLGLKSRPLERRQQDRQKQSDDRDDDQQFDQGKGGGIDER